MMHHSPESKRHQEALGEAPMETAVGMGTLNIQERQSLLKEEGERTHLIEMGAVKDKICKARLGKTMGGYQGQM